MVENFMIHITNLFLEWEEFYLGEKVWKFMNFVFEVQNPFVEIKGWEFKN